MHQRSGDRTKLSPIQRVQKLTIALPRDYGLFTPFTTTNTDPGVLELIYDKLMAPSPWVAEPAEGVTQVDPSTWEVKLRTGIKWQDGQPLTADDVRFTFEYFRKFPTGRYTDHVNDVPDIAAVENIDALTVRLRCAYPCPDLGPITLADLPIIPRHIWESVADPTKVTDLPIGSGPYRLVEFNSNRGYRFVANAEYFAGAPAVNELVMPIIEDPSATFTALRTGELDAVARPVPPELVDQFSSDRDIKVAKVSPLAWSELRLNFRRFPFDQPNVRLAVSRALDRDELLRTVQLGKGRPAVRGYPHPDSAWTDPTLTSPYDPAEAKRLLDGAQVIDRNGDDVRDRADGSPLAFTIKVSASEPTDIRAADVIGEQLAKVGIKARVQTVDTGTFASLLRSYDFDMEIGESTPHGLADPTQFIEGHRASYLWRQALAYPEWDSLFQQWKATTTPADRKNVLFKMEQLFNRQPTAIPISYPDDFRAYRPASYSGWTEALGFGIVHKWSFLARTSGAG